jgi:ribosomal protein S18 acetylase RimI-like enzyme
MTEDVSVILTPVSNTKDAQAVRSHRNSCREFMTRNTDYISEQQQENWFVELDKNYNCLFLLNKIYHGVAIENIGYGYIRIEKDEVLLTGGIESKERGKGYGYYLFNSLVDLSKKYDLPIRLEVLKTNAAGIATYNKVGFKMISEDDRIFTMEYRHDPII